jgi:tetratricopeptide (TPR) repeat protein
MLMYGRTSLPPISLSIRSSLERTGERSEQSSGLGLGAFAAWDGVHDLENMAFLLSHLVIRSGISTQIDIIPPWLEQGGIMSIRPGVVRIGDMLRMSGRTNPETNAEKEGRSMTATRWMGGAALVFLMVASARADETEVTLKQANQALGKDEFDKAIILFTRTLTANPKLIEAYLGRAVAHDRKGDGKAAMADLDAAVKVDPKSVRALTTRGMTRLALGQHDKALADFDEIVRLDPKNVGGYINRGNVHSAKRDHDKALADFSKVIEIEPKFPFAYHLRGRTYLDQHQFDKALADFNKALVLDPKFVAALIGRGDLFAEKGDLDKAFIDFNRAVEIDPNNPEAYQARGDAWAEKGDYTKAIAEFSRVLKLNPKDGRAYISRGDAHNETGDFDKAIADLQQALKLYPDSADALSGLAWIRATCPKAELRDGKKALEYAEKACKLTEFKEAGFLDTLAAAYAELGQFDKAIEWQTKVLKSPDSLPKKELERAKLRLKLYKDGKPYRKE